MDDFNEILKKYCLSPAVDDWSEKEIVRQLYEWCARMNAAFDLQIATPALRIERTRFRAAGHYHGGRNGLGLARELVINKNRLNVPQAWLLADLAVQLLHEWQHLHGKVPRRRGYCNSSFRRKAAKLGLVVAANGRVLEVRDGPFKELLLAQEMDVSILKEPPPRPRAAVGSKMKKWTCGCTNARAALKLNARCETCGQLFQLIDVGV
jgi:hypothetical protein